MLAGYLYTLPEANIAGKFLLEARYLPSMTYSINSGIMQKWRSHHKFGGAYGLGVGWIDGHPQVPGNF
ncbi:hypothetical protein ZWY2020_039897 [Hordeum vulgare]|nr:hypothetical protein ZWY2020_039897 [Hordeum vulgare]